jgi:hypothetical protein
VVDELAEQSSLLLAVDPQVRAVAAAALAHELPVPGPQRRRYKKNSKSKFLETTISNLQKVQGLKPGAFKLWLNC